MNVSANNYWCDHFAVVEWLLLIYHILPSVMDQCFASLSFLLVIWLYAYG